MIKKIAILTSGGDAPGMNSAVKGVVNSAINAGLEAYVVYEGFKGLHDGNFKKVEKKDVKFINNLGGTAIYSARFPEFADEEVRKVAVAKMEQEGIDAVVVIGGDGSYMGAAKLTEMGIKSVGLPGTIDNDIVMTDFTIGFFTTLETIVNSTEQARDTSESHNRANIIEVMGRHAGDLAIHAAIATGAEVLSVPERKLSEEEIVKQVREAREAGNRSIIVMVTELMYDVHSLAKKIEEETSVETRATVLGHPQRGGRPAPMDRFHAQRMATHAVELLQKGTAGVAVGIEKGVITHNDILEVVKAERPDHAELIASYEAIK